MKASRPAGSPKRPSIRCDHRRPQRESQHGVARARRLAVPGWPERRQRAYRDGLSAPGSRRASSTGALPTAAPPSERRFTYCAAASISWPTVRVVGAPRRDQRLPHRLVLEAMADSETGATARAAQLGVTRQAIRYHLRVLQRLGMVERHERGPLSRWRVVAPHRGTTDQAALPSRSGGNGPESNATVARHATSDASS